MGLGVTVIGMVAASIFSTETVIAMKPGDTVTAGGYRSALTASATMPAPTTPRSLANSR
jgi:cytochrome c biogenesis factor